MKLPKTTKRYCPYCKKHTSHSISQAKRKGRSSLTYGAKQRACYIRLEDDRQEEEQEDRPEIYMQGVQEDPYAEERQESKESGVQVRG
jgi:hypothetical protein